MFLVTEGTSIAFVSLGAHMAPTHFSSAESLWPAFEAWDVIFFFLSVSKVKLLRYETFVKDYCGDIEQWQCDF